jgi:restriction system protein
MRTPLRIAVAAVSVAAFVAACFQPAFLCQHGGRSWAGYEVLAIGWLGVVGFDPRWWANVCLVLLWRWLLLDKPRGFPRVSFSLCLLVAPSALVLNSPIGCPGMDTPTPAIGPAAGSYLWAAALLVAAIGSALASRQGRAATNEA